MFAATGSTMTAAILSGVLESSFDRSQIVVRRIQRQRRQRLRNSWALGDAQRGQAGAGLRKKTVGVTVITAFEFQQSGRAW